MICIAVTPGSRKLAKVDLLNASQRCDLVELCLDHLVKTPDVTDLISGLGKPVLISCRREKDGGHFKGSEEQRLGLLRQAIVAGPEYIELELDIAKVIPRFGNTKRVISYTSLDKPLGNIDEIFKQAAAVNADVVKFTWPTPTLEAAWSLLAAVSKKRELPVVGMGLGKASVMLSLLGRRYGAPWIYAALEPGMEAYEGQPTVFDLDDVYGWREIGAGTRFVAVAGFGEGERPLVRILNAGFDRLELKMRCLPLYLGGFDKLAQMLDFLKINVILSSPFMAGRMISFAAQADEAAAESQFADLLLKQQDVWHGYNMIWRSALRVLEDAIDKKDGSPHPLDRHNVLVIGATPLAQSLARGIHRRKALLSVTSPNDQDAQRIAKMFDVRHVPFADVYNALADVVIFVDPKIVIGHHKSEFNPSYLRPPMTVMDLSRMPGETDFLKEARERGCRVVDPRAVFQEQVSSLFKSVTSRDLPPEALASADAE